MFYYLSKTIERPCISLGYLSLKANLEENKNNSVNFVILKIKCHRDTGKRGKNYTIAHAFERSGKLLITNMEF